MELKIESIDRSTLANKEEKCRLCLWSLITFDNTLVHIRTSHPSTSWLHFRSLITFDTTHTLVSLILCPFTSWLHFPMLCYIFLESFSLLLLSGKFTERPFALFQKHLRRWIGNRQSLLISIDANICKNHVENNFDEIVLIHCMVVHCIGVTLDGVTWAGTLQCLLYLPIDK